MAFIYKITNKINGKVYIGKTEKENPYERFEEHKQDYKKERKEIRPLYRAFNKYGIENFSFEILEETNEPDIREVFYIEKYKSYIGFKKSKGYNATLGGDGKKRIDENIVVEKYLKESSKTIKKIAKELNIHADSVANILKKNNIDIRGSEVYLSFIVLQIDKKTKNIIKEFYSVRDAARSTGNVRNAQHIREVCLGQRKSAYGYFWSYKNK
jgi:group I intron endonuclease